MSTVERLFTGGESPAATVVSCDWCGAPAIVCTAAERHVGGPPARIGLCEEHYDRLLSGSADGASGSARAEYERRRVEREAEIRRQRSAWQVRKAARQSQSRGRPLPASGATPPRPPGPNGPPALSSRSGAEAAEQGAVPAARDVLADPLDSEELVASILQGERMVAPVGMVDPRLEDPARRVERLQEALWPLVKLAEECGIFADCNPSQTHSVLVVGEVPVQALFNARDLLKRER